MSVQAYRGLTWDHPRGRRALEHTAAALDQDRLSLHWDHQSLEGFEATPIEQLAEQYDLLIIDHPHVGDAVASGCLQPIETVMGPEFLARLDGRAVGPSLATYQLHGGTWALPLDAATQVQARRADLVAEAPQTWDDVIALAEQAPVALSLSGPHAYLTFASLCQSLGAELATEAADSIVEERTGVAALDLLARLAARRPRGSESQNPISLLERMSESEDIALVPLVYGYVGYARLDREHPISFDDAPRGPDGRTGSTIGGTGLAVSHRTTVSAALREHIAWLISDEVQSTVIPALEGQPALRAAWTSPAVNEPVGGFYSRTLSTIERAWVRPRFAGFTAVQAKLSAVIREAVLGDHVDGAVLAELTRIQNAGVEATTDTGGAR